MSVRLGLPSLTGATAWLNSPPLTPDSLRGQVVLVDFWTLTCINWLRTQPYVRAWSRAYRADGLVVLAVHTPEFGFEHDVDLVRRAVADRGIDYPVAVDNDYAIWTAFDNHYWPALYFADRDGALRDFHFGEGRYEQSERSLQDLLGIVREPVDVVGTGVEAEADWDTLRTPETYLGAARRERFTAAAGYLPFNHWTLTGAWTGGPSLVVADEAGATIAIRFQARDAHLVLAPRGRDPVPFRVTLDGEPPGPAHGVDTDPDGRGVLREGRMYQLVRQPGPIVDRFLEITFHEPGAEAYAFTFG